MEPTIAVYNFCEQNFEEFCRNGSAAGFRHCGVGFFSGYVDLPLEDLTDQQYNYVRSTIEQTGMQPLSLAA